MRAVTEYFASVCGSLELVDGAVRYTFSKQTPVRYLGSKTSSGLLFNDGNGVPVGTYGYSRGVDSSGNILILWVNGMASTADPSQHAFATPSFFMGDPGRPGTQRVELFGEPYLLTLPRYDQLKRLYASCPSLRDGGRVFVLNESSKQDLYPGCDAPPVLLTIDTVKAPAQIFSYMEYGWRPMLVPLTENGLVSGCFPKWRNGDLLRAGVFRVKDVVVPVGNPTGGPVLKDIYLPDQERVDGSGDFYQCCAFDIADEDQDPETMIPWIVWDGALICSRVLIGAIWNGVLMKKGLSFF